MIYNTLKNAVKLCVPNLGFEAKDVSAQYLRTAVAMLLLCASVDSGITNLIGRWCSDYTLLYLNIQQELITENFSKLIIMHGNTPFYPNKRHPGSKIFSLTQMFIFLLLPHF